MFLTLKAEIFKQSPELYGNPNKYQTGTTVTHFSRITIINQVSFS